jgi:DNA polymerase (family X)
MITNSQIADNIALYGKLLDLHDEEPNLAKQLAALSFQIDRMDLEIANMPTEQVLQIRGVGKTIAPLITELLQTSKLQCLQNSIDKTPDSILQMMRIKGLGPKKLRIVWKDMQIETAADLLYACNENRLIAYKGFGEKSQQSILEATQFLLNSNGKFLLAQVLNFAQQLLAYLTQIKKYEAYITGAVRRQSNIVEYVEYVVLHDSKDFINNLDTNLFSNIELNDNVIECLCNNYKVKIYCTTATNLAYTLWQSTGNNFYTKELALNQNANYTSEQDICTQLGLPYIAPNLRDLPIAEATKVANNILIDVKDIKGVIHNHSTYSDGAATLKDMALACIQKGYEYLVISDHSQYASYANGLRPERIIEQHNEIDNLNKQLAPFTIFKSIECDILPNGELDYTPEILNSFDIIIASIHSVLNMTEEKAMERLSKVINNPYTSILGHPTGRLLLGRAGYAVNMKAIIDLCAINNVVIELNANPRRLDIDAMYLPYAMKKNVCISINPDAHSIDGIDDIQYGVIAARKGGITAKYNLSSLSLQEFKKFVTTQKQKRPS